MRASFRAWACSTFAGQADDPVGRGLGAFVLPHPDDQPVGCSEFRIGVPVAPQHSAERVPPLLPVTLREVRVFGQECQRQPSTKTAMRAPREGGQPAPTICTERGHVHEEPQAATVQHLPQSEFGSSATASGSAQPSPLNGEPGLVRHVERELGRRRDRSRGAEPATEESAPEHESFALGEGVGVVVGSGLRHVWVGSNPRYNSNSMIEASKTGGAWSAVVVLALLCSPAGAAGGEGRG